MNQNDNKTIRVQKFLATQGVASRREVEKMINAGRISVNGEVISIQGTKINPDVDAVAVDGKVVKPQSSLVYYKLHKPVGYTSTTSHKQDEHTVTDLVPPDVRLYPIGRLDKDSEGLILLTNDGELTHKLIHPKYHVDKVYRVLVYGQITPAKLKLLRTGIKLEEGATLPAKVEKLNKEGDQTWLQFTIREGKHRQIRRMCGTVDLHVRRLIRDHFGPITLGNLKTGQAKLLNQKEIDALKTAVTSAGR